MKLKLSSGGVPAGSYMAKFQGIEPTEPNEYGEGYRWKFEIANGPHTGARVSRTTGTNPTPKNQCGRFLMAVSGKSGLGEEIDLSQFFGRNYLIVV